MLLSFSEPYFRRSKSTRQQKYFSNSKLSIHFMYIYFHFRKLMLEDQNRLASKSNGIQS